MVLQANPAYGTSSTSSSTGSSAGGSTSDMYSGYAAPTPNLGLGLGDAGYECLDTHGRNTGYGIAL